MAGGRFCRRILGILLLLLPVESANDRLANHCCRNRVVCLSHSPCEARQFVSAQFSLGVELIGKTDDTQLFFWVQTSDLFDDLISSHAPIVMHKDGPGNYPRALMAIVGYLNRSSVTSTQTDT